EGFRKFLNEWDCTRTLQQFSEELGSSDVVEKPLAAVTGVKLNLAKSKADLDKIEKGILSAGLVVFDVESNSFDRLSAKIVDISLAWNGKESWYVPLRHPGSDLSEKEVKSFLSKIFSNEKLQKIAQNLKYDLELLLHDGIEITGDTEDTMLEGYLLHADR